MIMTGDIVMFLWIVGVMGIGFVFGWFCRKDVKEMGCNKCRYLMRKSYDNAPDYTTPQKIKDDPTGDFVPEKKPKEFGD